AEIPRVEAGVDPLHRSIVERKGDVVPHDVGAIAGEDDSVGAVALGVPGAGEHVELRAVVVGRVVEPIVSTRRMVGIEAGGPIAPSDAVADDVTDAGLAAADLEAVAVPCSPGARMDVAVAHGPTVLDEDGHFLRDEI